MGNESGVNPYAAGEPYVDTGTGAYPNPPAVVVSGAEHDPNPTGLVAGPPAEVTVDSPPEHLSEPTGAHPGPPPSVDYAQHPAKVNVEPDVKPKAIKPEQVEDKAITRTKKRSG